MSSLRLALKQSLAETGHLMEQEKEKERKRKREAERRRREQRKKRQQGRRQKRKDEDGRSASSSSLSSSSESSSGSDDDDDSSTSSNDSRSSAEGSSSASESSSDGESRSSAKEVGMEGVFDSEVSSDDEEDDSARRDTKQKKRAKNAARVSAANKIQAQWKKKGGGGSDGVRDSKKRDGGTGSDSSAQKKKKKKSGGGGSGSKKKSSQQQTCPPPANEIIAWMRQMSIQKQRRHMERGLRVKVRFVTKSNKRGKDGKPLRRLKWYGGLVTDIATGGKRIRIKYDDGTSEVADFPDKDIVVDNEGNGQHRHGTEPEVFQPPPPTKRRTPSPRERPASVEFEVKVEKDSAEKHNDSRSESQVVPEMISSPPTPKQEKQIQTPTASKPAANYDIKLKSPSPDHPPQSQQTPSATTTKASAVSESPFSPAHNSAAGSTPSSSSSSASTSSSSRSGSFDGIENCDRKERSEGGAGKKRKRASSPIPPTVQTQVETSEAAAKESADSPNGRKPKSLHIKLIPLKLKKDSSDKDLGSGPSSKPPTPPRNDSVQVESVHHIKCTENDIDSMDVDDPGAQNKPQSPKDPKDDDAGNLEEDAGDSKEDAGDSKENVGDTKEDAGDSKRSEPATPGSKKRGSSPTSLDAACEPPRKKTLTELPPPVEGDVHGKEDAGTAPASAPAPEERSQATPSKGAAIASKSTAFSSYNGTSAKRTLDEPKKEAVELDVPKAAKPGLSSEDAPLKMKVDSSERVPTPPQRSSAVPLSHVASSSNKKQGGDSRERSPSPVQQNTDSTSKYPPKADRVESSNNEKEKSVPAGGEDPGPCPASEAEASKSPASSSKDANRGRRPRVKLPPVARSGRRAAQKANELIVSKEERIIQDEFAKPKKKKDHQDLKLFPTSTKSFDEDDSDDDDDEDDDEHWVQCDRCEKWRLLPATVQMDTLPDRWFCELNIYDSVRNNCEAAEQTAQEIAAEKKLKEASEKKKLTSVSPRPKSKSPVTSADNVKGGKSSGDTNAPSKRSSPAPRSDDVTNTRAGESRTSDQKAKRRSPVTVDPAVAKASDTKNNTSSNRGVPSPKPRTDAATASDDGAGKANSVGHAKKAKQKSGGDDSNATGQGESDTASVSTSQSKPKSSSRNRNRPKSSKESEKGKKPSKNKKESKEDVDNQEWVQCEKCEKWRKLPPKISAEDLPEVWYCSMNTWDPNSASCGADEDKMEAGHREFQIMGEGGTYTTSFGSSGKLSYRNLIFGTGRKQSRPISERQRAADSLFSNQPIDGPPSVMYANSSAFVYRNFNQKSAVDENRASFLDVMSQSKLWDELYSGARAIQALSLGIGGYEHLNGPNGISGMSEDMFVRSMKALVYHALGSKTLAGHEVLLEAQCRQWDDAQWAELRAACTIEIVTHALVELIKDGLVEATPESHDASGMGTIQYRRTNLDGLKGAHNGESKNSRCMKIAKPWKKASSLGM